MSIKYKFTPIKLKNGKTSLLEEIDSIYFPDDVWNNIKSFLPRPVSKTAVIVKNSIIKTKIERINRYTNLMELNIQKNIDYYTREYMLNPNNDDFEYIKRLFKTINGDSILPYFGDILRTEFYYYKSYCLCNTKKKFSKVVLYETKNLIFTEIKQINISTWSRDNYLKLKYQVGINCYLSERNILPEYTRDKRPKKIGTIKIFEQSKKDYIKRKKALVRK